MITCYFSKAIAVSAIDSSKFDSLDCINEDNEAVRIAAGAGIKALQSLVRTRYFRH
jgi:hypothetical protein